MSSPGARKAVKAEVDGVERLVHAGEVFPASHKLVKGREDLFRPEQARRPRPGGR